jgi:hypothetical protein
MDVEGTSNPQIFQEIRGCITVKWKKILTEERASKKGRLELQ